MTLRICQVMLSRGFGGAERLFVDLVIGLHEFGYGVLPICHPRGKARDLLSSAGIHCACVNNLGWWDPVAPRRIRALARKFGADILHTHLARATYLAARARPDMPLIASLHNYGKNRYYHNADLYIPITEDGARHLRDMGVAEDRITVIPNFSRVPPVAEVRCEADDVPRLLAYGRFVEKKGFADLLDALSLIKQDGINFRLRVGGAGELEDQLREQVRQRHLADNVEFIGWIEDVVKELDRSDLFVLPSRSEPFGIVVLEAMARGVPIVTTATEGPREFLSQETAWFAPIADHDALAGVIKEAVSDPHERTRKAGAALSLYSRSYTARQIVPRIINLYESAARVVTV